MRILLVEDHAIIRAGVKSLLSSEPELEVVGEAEDGMQAVALTKSLKPDLILMDLSMPLLNGTEAMKQIKARHPEIKVIVLTMHKTDEYVRATLNAGANGYVLKDDTHQDLLAAIKSVENGGTYLSSKVCAHVVSGYLGSASPQGFRSSWETLTDREREVMKLVAEGHKNRDVAEKLFISVKTVEKHRANVMRKLDLHSTAALTTFAVENGLVTS